MQKLSKKNGMLRWSSNICSWPALNFLEETGIDRYARCPCVCLCRFVCFLCEDFHLDFANVGIAKGKPYSLLPCSHMLPVQVMVRLYGALLSNLAIFMLIYCIWTALTALHFPDLDVDMVDRLLPSRYRSSHCLARSWLCKSKFLGLAPGALLSNLW